MTDQIWSCGGGTQSGAIAVLIQQGKLPKPDIALMIDTGRERSSTWPFVDEFIRPVLTTVGVELHIVKKVAYATVDTFSHQEAFYCRDSRHRAALSESLNHSVGEWKRRVAERWRRSIDIESGRMWIGISLDETRRIRTPQTAWLQLWYPLIFEVPLRRHQCVELIRAHGRAGHIPHSACYMCPNLGDAEWIDMKLNWPEDFKRACELETEIRQRDTHFFLHSSCVSLESVDFFAQQTMFVERGCTGGCFT